jgi:hypothetical protein
MSSTAIVQDWKNNPFERETRLARSSGVVINTNFENPVYGTTRNSASRKVIDPRMTIADLNKEGLSSGPKEGDATHYCNNFMKKFINETFQNDYDIGKNSVYRSQADIDKDTVNIKNR